MERARERISGRLPAERNVGLDLTTCEIVTRAGTKSRDT